VISVPDPTIALMPPAATPAPRTSTACVSLLEALLVLGAGVAAGGINAIVGSGTLITFPTLLAVGLDPVTANVSNTIGLVPGSLSGVVGYRRELRGQRTRVLRLAPASAAGGLLGGVLLLVLPDEAFAAVVPALIAIGCVLVVLQPWLNRRLAQGRDVDRPPHGSVLMVALVFATGVYGGYFGAAQGVLLVAIMGLLLDEHLQRINATKNVLALLVNSVAAVLFVVVAEPAWAAVVLIAIGSTVGGQLGARLGRRLRPGALRAAVVVVGAAAVWRLLA
jgi:uncharacterized membrane protein YfcA